MLNVLGDAFLVFYAIWTVVEQLSYFLGLSFAQSWLIGCSTGMLGVGIFFFLTGIDSETKFSPMEKRSSSVVSDDAHDNEAGLWPKLIAMCLGQYAAIEEWITKFRKFRIIEPVTVFSKGAAEFQPRSVWSRYKSIEAHTLWNIACWVCAIVAAVVTMCLHRPDAEDIV